MNIFEYTIPEIGENFITLFENKNIKIIRIVSSDNLEDIEYCQDEDEFVILLEGKATLEIEGKKVILIKGDTLYIPATKKHKVIATQKGTIWLAIHFNPNCTI